MQRLIAPAKFPAEFGGSSKFWSQHREATRNWLALGLLLAAWNAADDDDGEKRGRPQILRSYPCVSVRAATRMGVAMDR